MDLSAGLDESQMGVNKSLMLYPHLHNRRRKREDSVGVPPAGTGRSSPTPTTRASSGRPPWPTSPPTWPALWSASWRYSNQFEKIFFQINYLCSLFFHSVLLYCQVRRCSATLSLASRSCCHRPESSSSFTPLDEEEKLVRLRPKAKLKSQLSC